jgi:hypothetical protein
MFEFGPEGGGSEKNPVKAACGRCGNFTNYNVFSKQKEGKMG